MIKNRWNTVLMAALAGAVGGVLLVILRTGEWARFDPVMKAHRGFLVACVLIWVLFSLYWEKEAKKAAAGKQSESSGSRLLHVVAVNLALLLEVVPIRGLGRYVPGSAVIMSVGVAIELMGALFAIWARVHLGRNWSGIIAIKESHRLIRTGPYRHVRHPIYAGLLGMYVGAAVVTGEWLALVGVALAILAYRRKIRLEEAALEAAFGVEYTAYQRESRALIPGVF